MSIYNEASLQKKKPASSDSTHDPGFLHVEHARLYVCPVAYSCGKTSLICPLYLIPKVFSAFCRLIYTLWNILLF